jgi:excisionase family DNA binding protein
VDEVLDERVLMIARVIAAAGIQPVPERTEPYAVAEAAKIIGINKSTLYRQIQSGKCKALRIGTGRGTLRITPAHLSAYKAYLEAQAVPEPPRTLRMVTA